jgi:hypothetical protein
MKIESVEVQTFDQCLDVLEAAIQSDTWMELDKEEKERLVNRLSDILEAAEFEE